jgi:membrane protein
VREKILDFFTDRIWWIPDYQLSSPKAFLLKSLRIVLLSIHGFNKDLCSLRASALTLYSLLSIVPVIALLFGIAKGFGFEKLLKQRLLEQSADQDTVMLQVMDFSEKMLQNTQGGVVAGIGVIILFWTVIKVIGNIEESFNAIWKIPKNRPLARKLSDYLSMMLLAPVLLVASGSLTVFIKTQVTGLIALIHLPEAGSAIVFYLLSFLPWLIMMVLFSFIYIFMPNRKIDFRAGIIAGVITGILFQWMQWAYISLQFALSSYNAIYGSFAALPLFLIWLQLTWFIVLLGCELAFYLQNYTSYCHNQRFSGLSSYMKKAVALLIMHQIVTRFARAEQPLNADQLAEKLQLPLLVVQQTLKTLLQCRLIVLVTQEDEIVSPYLPAFDVQQMTIATIIKALETEGVNNLPDNTRLQPYLDILLKWQQFLEHKDFNRLLLDIDGPACN